VEIFSIGFTQTSAKRFFKSIESAGIRKLIDVRLNNTSQLAGFTRRDDLQYFLKELIDVEYVHVPDLAPTAELLKSYRSGNISWDRYAIEFRNLLSARKIEDMLTPDFFAGPSVLLCSEATPEHCHRRLVIEYLNDKWAGVISAIHL
jgi:uncharacterized protein (DUF488 family)